MRFAVCHAITPTFGLTSLGSPDAFRVVARGELTGVTDLEACNHAWLATNTIERPWYGPRAQGFGLTNVVPARSTSVGDLVKVEDEKGERVYQAVMVGWEPYSGPLELG